MVEKKKGGVLTDICVQINIMKKKKIEKPVRYVLKLRFNGNSSRETKVAKGNSLVWESRKTIEYRLVTICSFNFIGYCECYFVIFVTARLSRFYSYNNENGHSGV